MSRPVLQPSVDHPITIRPTPGEVVVIANGVVVARTKAALTLSEAGYSPVQYIPIGDVDQSLLHPSDRSTYCPFKGEASYYTVATPDGAPFVDAVWTYNDPFPAVAEIAGHVAFYTDRPSLSVSISESSG